VTYEEFLNALHGLLGQHLYATLSPAAADGKNVAGFSGVLERGSLAGFPIVSDNDEQLVFIVRPRSGGGDGAQLTVSPSTFGHAVWVDGPLARELVVRTGGIDIALMPTGEDA
jgi:hypothetical protein